jgi:hypothetical protein
MLKPLSLQDGRGALGLTSHTVSIERVNKHGNWTQVPISGSVRPEDAIRYSAHFSNKWLTERASFWVTNSAGQLVWGDPEKYYQESFDLPFSTRGGNAWLDATAPALPGVYILHVGDSRNSDHVIQRTFKVDLAAPEPPTSGLGGFGVQKIPWWVWIVLSLVVVVGVGIAL